MTTLLLFFLAERLGASAIYSEMCLVYIVYTCRDRCFCKTLVDVWDMLRACSQKSVVNVFQDQSSVAGLLNLCSS